MAATGTPPFDAAKLDALMEEAGVDLVLASSRHNVRYLLGDYSTFFAHFDAIGVERYLPLLGYPRGRPTWPSSSTAHWIAGATSTRRRGSPTCATAA